ncbi:PAS domain-containing protein [Sphingobium sp. WTD-1]|uniref:PAS domain-containing protein n=1 Tax=Sphingobium sp. WTD-1 TaxID=2979467 RepID=UPI0024DEB936|nr:PAS domain-containing protein [Sphingobium sp. WTD-1]WIA57357.1 PAS domain-containing protein [Sphingobium sp. WTD-1]
MEGEGGYPAESPVVTAADLVRGFSECRDMATRAPLYITHHGRATHVLLGVNEFRALKAQSGNAHQESAEEKLFALADWVDQAVIICDQDMRVNFVNRVASAICRKPAGQLVGFMLDAVLSSMNGSLMEVHVRRTVSGGEPSAADVPSPFADGAWLRLQSFPLGRSTVIMFRDITEDVRRHRLADAKAAIIEAMTVHGDVGYVRLSVRGTIDSIDVPFTDMLSLPRERVMGIQLTDLVITHARAAFRQALERAMQGQGAQCVHTTLLRNRGDTVAVKASIVALQGAYGTEGAVVLVTALDASAIRELPRAAE